MYCVQGWGLCSVFIGDSLTGVHSDRKASQTQAVPKPSPIAGTTNASQMHILKRVWTPKALGTFAYFCRYLGYA